MKKHKLLRWFPFLFLGIISFFIGCQDETTVEPTVDTDQAALEKMVQEDSSLSSFDYNYNEEGLETFLGKVNTEIYPFKVGQKMRLVSSNLNIDFQDSIAYGHLTLNFEGTLFIAATYDSNGTEPDTVIEKPFAATITRNLIFKRIARSPNPYRNWILAAISLPEGGTPEPRHIDMLKLTAYFENGDTLVIDSPNDYYLRRGWGWWKQIPLLRVGESVTIRVEVYSEFEENDYVTLTYGANRWVKHRAKKIFDLESITPSGNGWLKVYVQTYTTHQWPGFYHAVINAMPRQVIHDDAAPVEAEAWGIPYFVHL